MEMRLLRTETTLIRIDFTVIAAAAHSRIRSRNKVQNNNNKCDMHAHV